MNNLQRHRVLDRISLMLDKFGVAGHNRIEIVKDISVFMGAITTEEQKTHPTLKSVIPVTATAKLIESEDEDPAGYRGKPKIEAFYRRRRLNSFTAVNSVVQVNEKGPAGWVGCIVQVTEMKSWGVQACLQLPGGNIDPGGLGRINRGAYIRLKHDQIDYIGKAVLIPAEEKDEE